MASLPVCVTDNYGFIYLITVQIIMASVTYYYATNGKTKLQTEVNAKKYYCKMQQSQLL